MRNTQDVDIILRRQDIPAAIQAMEAAGFYHTKLLGVEMFLDGPDAKPRDAVHVLFAQEKVKPEYVAPVADVSESQRGDHFQMVELESLVRMKLTSFRDKDRTHLRDMIDVGLIDATWPARFVQPLASQLQELLDSPEG